MYTLPPPHPPTQCTHKSNQYDSLSAAGQKAPEICLPPPPQYWHYNYATITVFFIWVLGIELRSLSLSGKHFTACPIFSAPFTFKIQNALTNSSVITMAEKHWPCQWRKNGNNTRHTIFLYRRHFFSLNPRAYRWRQCCTNKKALNPEAILSQIDESAFHSWMLLAYIWDKRLE